MSCTQRRQRLFIFLCSYRINVHLRIRREYRHDVLRYLRISNTFTPSSLSSGSVSSLLVCQSVDRSLLCARVRQLRFWRINPFLLPSCLSIRRRPSSFYLTSQLVFLLSSHRLIGIYLSTSSSSCRMFRSVARSPLPYDEDDQQQTTRCRLPWDDDDSRWRLLVPLVLLLHGMMMMVKSYSNPSFFQWIFYSTATAAAPTHTSKSITQQHHHYYKLHRLYMCTLYIAKDIRSTCHVACDF